MKLPPLSWLFPASVMIIWRSGFSYKICSILLSYPPFFLGRVSLLRRAYAPSSSSLTSWDRETNSGGSLGGEELPEFGVEGRSKPESFAVLARLLEKNAPHPRMHTPILWGFGLFRSEEAESRRSKEPYGLLSSSFHILIRSN